MVGVVPGEDWSCRHSGELGSCAERDGGCDEEDEGAGEVHGEGDEVPRSPDGEELVKSSSKDTLREQLGSRNADGVTGVRVKCHLYQCQTEGQESLLDSFKHNVHTEESKTMGPTRITSSFRLAPDRLDLIKIAQRVGVTFFLKSTYRMIQYGKKRC